MGRKINPLTFRSKYKYKTSNWVTFNENYSKFLKEDNLIRNIIDRFFQTNGIHVDSIYIFRKNSNIVSNKSALYLIIYLSRTKHKKAFYKTTYLKNIIDRHVNKEYVSTNNLLLTTVNHKLISKKFYNFLIKLKQQTSTKLLISNFMAYLQKTNKLLGAKVIVKGRVEGCEKARMLKNSFGCINLQKITSKIGFLSDSIQTKDGLVNVKLIYNIK